MLDRRKEKRFPAYLGGVIAFSQDCASAECVIRNRSESGARLIVHNAGFVPDEFDLLIPHKETAYRVRTRWRQIDALGVEITSLDNDNRYADPAATRRIKRLELENRLLKRRLRCQEQ